MADFLYNTASADLWNGTTDFITDSDIKMGLATSSYVADRDNDFLEEAANDFNEHELSGGNYTAGFGGAGRKVLASKSITVDKSNDRAYADCADITWTALGAAAGTPSQAITLEERTNDADSALLAHHDSGFPVTPNGGDVTVQIAAGASGGLFYLATA